MATQTHSNWNALWGLGAMALAILLSVFLIGGGHNNGQPSAQNGPGNAMRTDPGR
ncbi:MAG TPA: hypothetical protein VJQ06_02925 [Rhizomicrobium sp.]|nr:hypothetical protein [Rhizomicrobium sp.]